MALTSAQLATLKAAILADGTANANPNTSDGNFALAIYLNTVPGSPTQLWRPAVPKSELDAVANWTAFGAQTAIKQNIYFALTSPLNATSATVRSAFAQVWTVAADQNVLLAIAQRPGTRFEVIFSSGGPPATSTMFGIAVTGQDCKTARDS